MPLGAEDPLRLLDCLAGRRKIWDADVGYWILDFNTKQLTVKAIPVYRLILEDGTTYYIDTEKNELLDYE